MGRSYLDLTTYEISCLVLREASLAPEDKIGLIVSTLMPYELVRRIYDEGDYESFKKFCIDTITQVLEKSLFPDLLKQILFSLCSTLMTIEKETGNTQVPLQVGHLRMKRSQLKATLRRLANLKKYQFKISCNMANGLLVHQACLFQS